MGRSVVSKHYFRSTFNQPIYILEYGKHIILLWPYFESYVVKNNQKLLNERGLVIVLIEMGQRKMYTAIFITLCLRRGSSGFVEQRNWGRICSGIRYYGNFSTEFFIPAGGGFSRKWFTEYGILRSLFYGSAKFFTCYLVKTKRSFHGFFQSALSILRITEGTLVKNHRNGGFQPKIARNSGFLLLTWWPPPWE